MKRCILYDGKICDNCGECMRCDLDPNKICDNCGKCLERSSTVSTADEFRSMVISPVDPSECDDEADDSFPGRYAYADPVHRGSAERLDGASYPDDDSDDELSDEERQLLAFLDEPVDLQVPEPLQIDPELVAKWEKILADYEREQREKESDDDTQEPEIRMHGVRKLGKKKKN